MKLKPKKVTLKELPKQRKSGEGNKEWKKYSDEYTPLAESDEEIVVRRFLSKDGDQVEQYIKCHVKRFNDDAALPMVFMQMFQRHDGDGYSGPLKGKTIYFPLANVADIQDVLTSLADTCDRLKVPHEELGDTVSES